MYCIEPCCPVVCLYNNMTHPPFITYTQLSDDAEKVQEEEAAEVAAEKAAQEAQQEVAGP
jgi:hypothetical protein